MSPFAYEGSGVGLDYPYELGSCPAGFFFLGLGSVAF